MMQTYVIVDSWCGRKAWMEVVAIGTMVDVTDDFSVQLKKVFEAEK